ncbi:unnamed protein product [Linum trigynum]|uniref:Uncharacterized protein n=1 Tax=Linum trigynum TaxID=586398 RepID=A0AAV2EDA0_9ROSI
MSSLFLLCLKNQNGGRHRRAGDLRLGETGQGDETVGSGRRQCYRSPVMARTPLREGCCPSKVLCKRKRARFCEDFTSSFDMILSHSSPAKKCRCVRLCEWRFVLPSSVDLVGEESLLSTIDGFSNGLNISLGRADDQVGSRGRDFVEEAAEVRKLVLLRPRHPPPAVAADRSADKILGGSAWITSPQIRDVGTNDQRPSCSDLISPVFSGLLGCCWYICFQRDKQHRESTHAESPNPISSPNHTPTVTLRRGFKGGLGPLFIPSSLGLPSSAKHHFQCRGETAEVGASGLLLSLGNCSGIWELFYEPSLTHSFIAAMVIQSPVMQPRPNHFVDAALGCDPQSINPRSISCCQELCTMAHVSEDQVVQFSLEDVQSTRFRAARSLLGRLFTND